MALAVAAAAAAGCALSSGLRHREEAEVIGQRLQAAGFHAVPADTPERQVRLERLPPLLFSTVVRDGERRYVLADPYRCRCAYVGDEAAYARYSRLEVAREDAASERAAELTDEEAGEVDRKMENLWPDDESVVFPSGTEP
jgi:hypothetical protein